MSSPVQPAEQLQRASEAAYSDALLRIGGDEVRAWTAIATPAQAAQWHPGPGPLEGLTMGVKDVIDLAGLPTRCGSALTSPEPVSRTAPFVEQLIELGVMPVGKTVTTEFAFLSPGPTQNPRAPGHSPGGSSSGSAAAVAAGHVPLGLGTQTAGSLIRPASYCGIAGLVLRHGSVALDGFLELAPSLDAPGLLAESVAAIEVIHRALNPAEPARGLARKALYWTDEVVAISDDMHAAVRRATGILGDLGLEIEELGDRLALGELLADHYTVMQYEAARAPFETYGDRSALSEPLRGLIEAGDAIDDEAYAAALERAAVGRGRLEALLGDDVVIVGPAAQGAAPAGLAVTGSPDMSRPWQLLGVPQLAVSGCTDPAGLPLGVQLIARGGAEGALLATGCALEVGLGHR